ncbi:MAG: DMT family transporter [Planctomycetota bacterium]|nr:DMT family transporter [Planctomycetota bacterium]
MFALVCVTWGTAFILMRQATAAFGPITIGAGRSIFGSAALALLWLPVRRTQSWRMTRADAAPMLLVVVLCYALPYFLQPYVIPRIGSSLMGMMMALIPLLTVGVSITMLGVYPTLRQIVGVVGGLLLMMFLLAGAWKDGATGRDLFLAAMVPAGYSIGYTYVKRRFSHVPPLPLACVSIALAAVPLVPLSLAFEHVTRDEQFTAAAGSLLLLGVFCTGVAAYLYYKLIQDHGPLHAVMTMYIVPLVAIFWGYRAGEPITLTKLLLLLGVLSMVALVQWRPAGTRAPEPVPATSEPG